MFTVHFALELYSECTLVVHHTKLLLYKLSEHENECNVLDPEPGGGVHPSAQPGHANPPARPLVNIFDSTRTQLAGLYLLRTLGLDSCSHM